MRKQVLLVALAMGVVGCGEEDEVPVDMGVVSRDLGGADVAVGTCPTTPCTGGDVCGPAGACQAGVVGDACLSAAHCDEGLVCGPDATCGTGAEGEPCTTSVVHCQADLLCSTDGVCQDGTLGDPCYTNADCAYDPDGAIYACGDADECELVDCRSSSDCPQGDTCDYLTYQCETPEPTCGGVATSCYGRSVAQCTQGFGCTLGGDCTGYATSCYSLFSSYSCSRQSGCYWSTSTSSCSGVATSCYSRYSSTSCNSQAGCSWDESCSGLSTSCYSLDAATCLQQPGCSLSYP